MRDSDLIIFSHFRWDAPYSSTAFSLAKEFAKTNRVFYIDHPFSVKDLVKEYKTPRIQRRKEALLWKKNIYTKSEALPGKLVIVTVPLMVPVNFLPEGSIYNSLADWNDNRIFDTIRRIIRDHNVKQFIYINAFDPYYCRNFPSDIKPLKKIYQSMDDLSQVEYTAKHGTRLEAETIRNSDITLTTSRELKKLALRYSKNVYLQPNDADFSVFSKAVTEKFAMPAELEKARGKKIIGYTGNIESRIDYEVLQAVVEYHQDKMIAMVGPVTTDEHKTIGLTEYSNVIMTGAKKLEELPAYLQYFDCALIPFKKNTLTRSIYPLKINEYLAAGKAVVSTDFSEDIIAFGEVIKVASTAREFAHMIDEAISETSAATIANRIEVAKNNTWEARVEQFWKILEGNYIER